MRRLAVNALFIAVIAVADASAAGLPGTAQFATPVRGTAVVVPSARPNGVQYVPAAYGTRFFTVFARQRRGAPRRPTRILMKHKAVSKKCAPSFAADTGRPIGLDLNDAVPNRYSTAPGGYLHVSSKEIPWRIQGRRRFCIWLTDNPKTVTRPSSSVIEFYGHTIGAVLRPEPKVGNAISTEVVSTLPVFGRSSTTRCPPEPDSEIRADKADLEGLYRAGEFHFSLPQPGCDHVQTLAVSTSLLGPFTLSMSFAEAAGGAHRHQGLCVFPRVPNAEASVATARALVEAQGCRVGRLLPSVSPFTKTLAGDVWEYTVNGAYAPLVPVGTRVDLVVNRPS